jgi:hypothetical protein
MASADASTAWSTVRILSAAAQHLSPVVKPVPRGDPDNHSAAKKWILTSQCVAGPRSSIE